MKKYMLCCTAALFLYVSFFTGEPENQAISGSPYTDPVLFIHGFKGNARSFQTMIHRFEKRGWGHPALVIHVTRTGKLLVREHSFYADRPAFIQVVFENNRSSFDVTSASLAAVMQMLKKEYGMDQVKIVSHSMGGIVSVKFLQERYDPALHPVTDQLVTLGSPFGGVAGGRWFKQNHGAAVYDLMPGSPALARLASNTGTFPPDTFVLNIAGTGDQVTPLESALRLGALMPESQYAADVFHNELVDHSNLHETVAIDEKIGAFFGYH